MRPGVGSTSFRPQVLLSQIIRQEPLISENRRPALRQLIQRLIEKMQEQQHHSFSLFKVGRGLMRGPLLWEGSGKGQEHVEQRDHGSWKLQVELPTNLMQVLRAHILPLTNCAFNKSGDRFITGSYDRTCKVRHSPCSWERTAFGFHSICMDPRARGRPLLMRNAWPVQELGAPALVAD